LTDSGVDDPGRHRDGEDPEDESAPPEAEERPIEGPVSGEVRIDALEASVAAGLVLPAPPPPAAGSSPPVQGPVIGPPAPGEPGAPYELLDWSDPPTGQVPRVLMNDLEQEGADAAPRGPTWREGGDDWDDDLDLSYLAEEDQLGGEIAGRTEPGEAPFEFVFDEPGENPEAEEEEDAAHVWASVLDQPIAVRRRHAAPRRKGPAPTTRSGVVATVTGAALGLVALLCLLWGPAPTDALVAVLATVAAGEAYHGLQRATYRPATLVGLLAVPCLVVSSYLWGTRATTVVLAGAVVLTALWFLRRRASEEMVVDASATLLVVVWVGVLASFASLLLSPSAHPNRHGVAFVAAALALAVAHDVGSYAVGSRFGRHLIAPRLSPAKTLEGLIGGTVLDLALAAAVVSRIHPISMSVALGLGAFVAVFAPLGDLFESAVKRDLGLKDMGNLLPAHGGVLDRVDAMLFVLPAAWCLFRLANLA